MALAGPDEKGIFDAEFDREAESLAAALTSATTDLGEVFPEAEIVSRAPISS